MARATTDQAATRRQRVSELYAEGLTVAGIALAIGSDPRTVQRDLAALSAELTAATDLAGERLRLIEAARAVERESWALYRRLSDEDSAGKLGALSRVLQSQAQGAKVIADLANADLERRMAQMEEQMSAVVGATKGRPL